MTPFVVAGAGFLAAVLWFDLMFDVQVRRHRAGALPDDVLASIAGYYARVTTGARPMTRLVAAAMVATLGSIVGQIVDGDAPDWVSWAALVLVGSAVVVAAAHTVPSAVRLGARADPLDVQSRLARGIFRDHVFCLTTVAATLVVELGFG